MASTRTPRPAASCTSRRGLLGLIKSEAQLADVLGHEITHITAKHTVRAIQKKNAVQLGAEQTKGGSLASAAVSQLAGAVYSDLFENKFDRNDEMEADRVGIVLANKVGYSPNGSTRCAQSARRAQHQRRRRRTACSRRTRTRRRASTASPRPSRNRSSTATATVAARYKDHITWDAKPAAEITTVDAGAKGLTGGSSSTANVETRKTTTTRPRDKKDADQPKKKGGFLNKMSLSGGSQAQSSQTIASAGGRAIGNDNNAKGGTNSQMLP